MKSVRTDSRIWHPWWEFYLRWNERWVSMSLSKPEMREELPSKYKFINFPYQMCWAKMYPPTRKKLWAAISWSVTVQWVRCKQSLKPDKGISAEDEGLSDQKSNPLFGSPVHCRETDVKDEVYGPGSFVGNATEFSAFLRNIFGPTCLRLKQVWSTIAFASNSECDRLESLWLKLNMKIISL